MKHLAWRLLGAPPTLLGAVILTFLLTRLVPGDPGAFFANTPGAGAATAAAISAKLGLDQPLWRQFQLYLTALLQGDLGMSVTTGRPVLKDLLLRLPASAELTLAAFLLAAGLALPLGAAAALKPGGWADRACRLATGLGAALPSFVVGLALIFVFYAGLGVAPEPIGRLDPFAAPPPQITGLFLIDAALALDGGLFLDAAAHLALPALTMAIFALAPVARVTRAAMRDSLGADFVRAARANGLGWRKLVLGYAFRNALSPIVTAMGIVISAMLGANVLVEKLFAWPGMGSYALDALLALDHAPVQGFALAMAALAIGINLAIDLLCAAIDPRVRFGRDE